MELSFRWIFRSLRFDLQNNQNIVLIKRSFGLGFFFWQDTLMLGTDYYLTESGIASLLAEGKVPIGIGRETKIR